VWKVPFTTGTLRAVASDAGRDPLATAELTTAGVPSKLLLRVDRAALARHWEDVIYATATVVDDRGTIVPAADNAITFHIDGPGAIAAVESADPASHEPFQADHRRAFQGRCVAIVRATADSGAIRLTATADGLETSPVVNVTATQEMPVTHWTQ
jgi:beta-galactosidase